SRPVFRLPSPSGVLRGPVSTTVRQLTLPRRKAVRSRPRRTPGAIARAPTVPAPFGVRPLRRFAAPPGPIPRARTGATTSRVAAAAAGRTLSGTVGGGYGRGQPGRRTSAAGRRAGRTRPRAAVDAPAAGGNSSLAGRERPPARR